MAVKETPVLMTGKDKSGDTLLSYPITKLDCVDGAESLVKKDELSSLIPPVGFEELSLTWDGNTDGLTKTADYFGKAGMYYNFYKILDYPIIKNLSLKFCGTVKGTSYSRVKTFNLNKFNGTYTLDPCNENIYGKFGYLDFQDANLSHGAPLVFAVTKENSKYTSYMGTLTFPEIGLYVLSSKSAEGSDGRFESVSTVLPIEYDPQTMDNVASEITTHKVTSLDGNSTDEQYPSAKAVWDALSGVSGGADVVVPTKVSQLENDAGYVKGTDINVPTKLSELVNDAGYLKKGEVTIPDNLETTDNKVSTFNGYDTAWYDVDENKYPSTQAVYDFVSMYVSSKVAGNLNEDSLVLLYSILNSLLVTPALGTVKGKTIGWNGNTTGRFNILGMFYKISDSTVFPEAFKITLSLLDKSTGTAESVDILGTDIKETFTNYVVTDLKETLGIVVYELDLFGEKQPCIAVADRDGELPASVIEQLAGTNPGVNIPYKAGTYVLYTDVGDDSAVFISKAESYVSSVSDMQIKSTDTLATWDGNTEGRDMIALAELTFCKVSDSTKVYDSVNATVKMFAVSEDGTRTEVESFEGEMIPTEEEIFKPLGITAYADMTLEVPAVIIAERDGVITAEMLEELTGENPGFDITYKAGTYFIYVNEENNVTHTVSAGVDNSVSVKDYIDAKFDELKKSMVNGG